MTPQPGATAGPPSTRGRRAGAPRAPVMDDVARLAGVSHQTVSRVVNAQGSIRPATRERVERAIAQLGYRPNGVARALARGRTGVIGVVTTSAALYGPRRTEHALRDAARSAGFALAAVDLPEVTPEGLGSAVDDLERMGAEGVVVVAGHEAASQPVHRDRQRLPVVVVQGDPVPGVLSVGVDQRAGAELAVRHLVALGHRRVVHVAGPADWREARQRADGWRRAPLAAGLVAAAPRGGDWSSASGYVAGRVVADDPLATAVFAANDSMAVGVVHALHERGLEVPGDVSVVGFDDVPEAPFLSPPLTTVRQDFHDLGARAFALLSAALRGDVPPATGTVVPELVVRRSTAPPGRAAVGAG